MVQARDEAVHATDPSKMTTQVRAELLKRVNPEKVKSLASFLPLYRGMRLLLNSKDCVRFGVMKGCPCILRDIVFADDELLPMHGVVGHAHKRTYMPVCLLLQVEGAAWTLPASELPRHLPANIDRRGLFQLRPSYDYLQAYYEKSYFRQEHMQQPQRQQLPPCIYPTQASQQHHQLPHLPPSPLDETATPAVSEHADAGKGIAADGFMDAGKAPWGKS